MMSFSQKLGKFLRFVTFLLFAVTSIVVKYEVSDLVTIQVGHEYFQLQYDLIQL